MFTWGHSTFRTRWFCFDYLISVNFTLSQTVVWSVLNYLRIENIKGKHENIQDNHIQIVDIVCAQGFWTNQ